MIFNPFSGSKRSYFVELFQFVGTSDVGPYLCMEEGLKFRREVCGGEEKIMQYCEKVSNEGGEKVAEILATKVMENSTKTLTKCCMTNVKLPLEIGDGEGKVKEADAFLAVAWLARKLNEEHNMFAPPFYHGGQFWIRFSGQIYLETEDFVAAARAYKELCERVKRGEYHT